MLERQFISDQLVSSEQRLLEALSGLTPQQCNFKESPDRWSIAEIVEHLAVFEDFIRGNVERVLTEPVATSNTGASLGKESLVMRLATDRQTRLTSREIVRPCGRWPEMADAVDAFRRTRGISVKFCNETKDDLSGSFFAHIAFGDLDCSQWLLLLSQHTLRHVLQIEEIKANPHYPV